MPPRIAQPILTDRIKITGIAVLAVGEVVSAHAVSLDAPGIAEVSLPFNRVRRRQTGFLGKNRQPPKTARDLAGDILHYAPAAQVAHRIEPLAVTLLD